MLHVLSSNGCLHIPGCKEQTKTSEIIEFQPSKVYVAAVDNKGQPLDSMVEVGSAVKKGSLLGVRKDFSLPVYSPVSGKVTQIVKKRSPLLNRPVNYLEIENDKLNKKETLKKLKKNPTKEDVVNKLKEGGIVGLGGAGFPSFIKYSTKEKIDTILINAIECEPFLTTDYIIGAKEDLSNMLEAVKILLDVFDIQRCVIGIKKENHEMITNISQEVEKFGDTRISLAIVKSVYPAGWERALIKMALKREYKTLPSECGVIVNNLQTVISMGRLFFHGETISTRLITVSGEVNHPANIRLPYGTLVSDILEAVGGVKVDRAVVINGGPMTGKPYMNGDIPTTVQANAITVLKPKKVNTLPCLRCGECTAHCPANLQPCEINFATARGDYERAYKLNALSCVECGLCSYVCPSNIEVSEGVAKAKLMVRLKVAINKK
ncbi:MAG: RnfABCDGE type electron transport complex subunit C [Bacilli bacterium]